MRSGFLRLLMVVVAFAATQDVIAQDNTNVRFVAIDVYLDSAEPVAAWQFELKDRNGLMKIVGVENGESPAFARAPYYDREAVQRGSADRIIVADFSLAEPSQLPSGHTRIATLHLMLTGPGEPAFELELITAVRHDGRTIDASIGLESRTGSDT